MGGIGGSGATVVQMVVHSTCRAIQLLRFQANAVANSLPERAILHSDTRRK
jgi:hypothetical protein